MDPVASTGLYTAILRARESARPDRLFSDPFADVLAGPEGNDLLAWIETRSPGVSQQPIIPIRTKFVDNTLTRILDETGIDQLVILAAGLDARAFRLPLPPSLAVFELDRPETLDLKASRLAQLHAVPRCQRIPIPVDLVGDWSRGLQRGGFDRQRPAAWLVEGLLYYLTGTQVHHVLGTLSGLAAPGSWLIADGVSHSFLTAPHVADFLAAMAANGSPFHFGTDDPDGLLRSYGWQPQVTRYGEPGANFGRWTTPITDHHDPHTPRGYLIVAHRRPQQPNSQSRPRARASC